MRHGDCLDIFLSSFAISVEDGPIQTEILSQRAVKPQKTQYDNGKHDKTFQRFPDQTLAQTKKTNYNRRSLGTDSWYVASSEITKRPGRSFFTVYHACLQTLLICRNENSI